MVSKYPDDIDTDAELPRVDDNVSEVGSEALNAMREAIIAIQETLGTNPEGATASLVSRLSESLNDDGTLKASALIAAGLIALPITNAQIGASAAIEEGKLDLDVATQTLQDQITSNDIDIAELQKAIADLLNKFNRHINGLGFRHTTAHIDLATTLTSIVATDLDTALVAINDRFLDHVATDAVGAHRADNISVDTSNLEVVAPGSNNVQLAIEDLDNSRNTLFRIHRDEMHANGFSNWANDSDGYSIYNQKFPSSSAQPPTGFVVSGTRNAFEFDGYALSGFTVQQGDILVIENSPLAGQYVIDDVGPRLAIGSKPALASDQLEIAGTFADGYTTTPVRALIFAPSSLDNIKTNATPTIRQSDIRVDSIQIARPNSAKVVSLGIAPSLIDSTHNLAIEAGVGVGDGYRQITIDNLNFNRLGSPAPVVTVDTIVERINDVLQNRTDGYAFPVAAYRVGDELMLSHNWVGNEEIYLKVLSSGTGNFELGLDGYGADVVGKSVFPTKTNYFYVNGYRFSDVSTILATTADVVGSTFTLPSGINPLTAGVKIGHLLHLKNHTSTSEVGSYFVTGVTSTTITVAKSAGLVAENGVTIEIVHDALPLDDFNSNLSNQIVEAYLTSQGTLAYNERLSYTDNINNLSIVNVSDNFLPASLQLEATASSGGLALQLAGGPRVIVPTSFSGRVKLFADSNIEFIVADLTSVVGVGINDVTINEHVNEEEFLEVCTVRVDGALTVSDLTDRRLFGSTGLDEIREDVVQAYIETPLDELRSDGIVRGFDIVRDIDGDLFGDGYFDPSLYPDNQGIVVRGGTAYVAGVRCDVVTTGVPFPNVAGSYILALNEIGTYQIINTVDYSLTEVLDGYAGTVIPIASVEHNGSVITSAEDRRYFINDLDDKVELVLDLTNRMIGTFASMESALGWIEAYPYNEKFKVRLVSNKPQDITVRNIGRDLTIALDGKVRNLTLNNPCRLLSDSIADRGFNHIDGYLTIGADCTDFEADNLSLSAVNMDFTASSNIQFRNCFFDGYGSSNALLTNTGGVYSELKFINCNFSDDSRFDVSVNAGGSLLIDQCTFENSGVYYQANVSGANAVVTNSTFNGVGLHLDLVPFGQGIVTNSSFSNITTTSAVPNAISSSANSHVKLSEVTFNSCSTSGNSDIFVNLQGSIGNAVSNCYFVGSSVSANDELLNIVGTINNCIFSSVTFPANQAITSDKFSGNFVVGSAAAMLVGCREFTNNTGVNAVTSKSSSEELRIVTNSIFDNSSQGFNIDLTALDNGDDCIIDGNVFDVAGATTMNAISFTTTNPNTVISNNRFEGDGYDVAIALDSADNITIVGNSFSTLSGVTSTAQINSLILSQNQFISSDVALQVGDYVVIADNVFNEGTQTFSGASTANSLRMTNNIFHTNASPQITTTGLSEALISGNDFNDFLGLNLSSSLTNSAITNNTGGIISTTYAASNCIFDGNVLSFATINNITWDNSFISNNIFTHSGDTEFTLASTGGGVDANVLIQENIFNSSGATAVQISSTDPVRSFYFSENVNDSGGAATLVFNSQINEALVEGNFDFSINVANGSNTSLISGNMMPNVNLTLSDTCNSTLITNNFVANIDVECDSTGNLVFSNNFLTASFDVLTALSTNRTINRMAVSNNFINGELVIMQAADGYFSISDALFVNNFIVDDIELMTDTALGTTSVSMDNTRFINNVILDDIRIINNLASAAINATHSLSDIAFEGNSVGDDVLFFAGIPIISSSTIDIFPLLTFDGFKFSNNTVASTFNMSMPRHSTANNPPTLSNVFVESNTFGDSVFVGQQTNLDVFSFKNNVLSGGLTWSMDSLDNVNNITVSNVVIESNFFDTGFASIFKTNSNGSGQATTYTFEGFKFDSNFMGSNKLRIDRTDTSNVEVVFEKASISGNFLRAIEVECTAATNTGADHLQFEGLAMVGNTFDTDIIGGGADFSGARFVANTTGSGSSLSIDRLNFSTNTADSLIPTGAIAALEFEASNTSDSITIDNSSISNNTNMQFTNSGSVTYSLVSFVGNATASFINFNSDSSLIACAINSNTIDGGLIIDSNFCSSVSISGNTLGGFNIQPPAPTNWSRLVITGNVRGGSASVPTDTIDISGNFVMEEILIQGNLFIDVILNLHNAITTNNIDKVSITNNRFGTRFGLTEINIGGNVASNVTIQNNIVDSTITLNGDDADNFLIDNNNVGAITVNIGGSFTNSQIIGNAVDDGIVVGATGTIGITTGSNVSTCNIANNNASVLTTSISGDIINTNISNNVLSSLLPLSMSVNNITRSSFNDNIVVSNNFTSQTSNITATGDLEQFSFRNNEVNHTDSNDRHSINIIGNSSTDIDVSNNRVRGTLNIQITNGMLNSMVSGNSGGNGSFITISADGLTNAVVCNNSTQGMDLGGIATAITRLTFMGNTMTSTGTGIFPTQNGTITLPNISVFNSGANQSKIIGNFGSRWYSSGAAWNTDGGQTAVFPIGNTGNSGGFLGPSTITFSGIQNYNPGTSNNSGGGITVT